MGIKVKKIWDIIGYLFTPLKMLSFLILALGVIDNLTSLLQHTTGNGTIVFRDTILEYIVRAIFIFCGLFGILGNGKTKRFRATIVAFPLIYLAALYIFLFMQYQNNVLLAFIAMTLIPALWVLLFGDKYE